jgi:hypothetical protein
MAKLPGAFNASEHEKMGDFSPVPAGEYLAQIVKSELADTKAGTGKFLKMEFRIMNGQYKDRALWARLNIINPNAQAVEIAQKELATICAAVGLVRITDSEELHMKPLLIKVAIKPGEGQYLDSNEIKNYSPAKGVAKPDLAAVASEDEPAPKGKKKAPWE